MKFCCDSKNQEIFNRRAPRVEEIEETLTLPEIYPGLGDHEKSSRCELKRVEEIEEKLTLPKVCPGLPTNEETLTMPEVNPGLRGHGTNRCEPKREEILTLPRICSGLLSIVRVNTFQEETNTSEKYSHGRHLLFILLIALAVLLKVMGERSRGCNLEKLPPPVRNDIKLQGSPFQDKKSYRLNSREFFRVSPTQPSQK